jgi:two-component system response regulator PhoP
VTAHEEMQKLHAIAVRMLPGFQQARAQLAVASHVLEYFATFPEYETSPGKCHPFELAEAVLRQEVQELRSMLNVFSRIHGYLD